MKFTEAKLEQAFTELLGNEDYPHIVNSSLLPSSVVEVHIEEDLKAYLLNRYSLKSFERFNFALANFPESAKLRITNVVKK